MKKYFCRLLKLTLVLIIIMFCDYTLYLLRQLHKLAPGGGKGETVISKW